MFCHEPLLGFWSDQSETYTDSIYMGWRCVFPLGGPHCLYVSGVGTYHPNIILMIYVIFAKFFVMNSRYIQD